LKVEAFNLIAGGHPESRRGESARGEINRDGQDRQDKSRTQKVDLKSQISDPKSF
jgi:hypothetical protein